MCARIIGAIKRGAFQHWMSRLGLAASLLLVLVPTLGRVAQAAAPHAAQQHAAHAQHRSADHAHRQAGDDIPRAALGDPDCDYCPLLSSMAPSMGIALAVMPVPAIGRMATAPRAPELRWRHPWGLGSRGPP